MTNTETKIQIYMPATMREQVHQAAEALRVSESEWIRGAIDWTQSLAYVQIVTDDGVPVVTIYNPDNANT